VEGGALSRAQATGEETGAHRDGPARSGTASPPRRARYRAGRSSLHTTPHQSARRWLDACPGDREEARTGRAETAEASRKGRTCPSRRQSHRRRHRKARRLVRTGCGEM
jgi:hypothetical protein